MKKRVWIPLCVIAVLIIGAVTVWCLFKDNFAPYYAKSYDVNISVDGSLFQISDVEAELLEKIGELEDKAENPVLTKAVYRIQPDGAETAVFTYQFDRPGTAYTNLWERLTSQTLSGTLELWMSLTDSKIVHVNYNFGQIEGATDTDQPLTNTQTDLSGYFNSLKNDAGYQEAVGDSPNLIKLELAQDTMSAKAYSPDEKKVLFTFPEQK